MNKTVWSRLWDEKRKHETWCWVMEEFLSDRISEEEMEMYLRTYMDLNDYEFKWFEYEMDNI